MSGESSAAPRRREAVRVARVRRLVVLLALGAAGRASGAQRADVIAGRITGPDSQPVSGARITVRGVQTRAERQTTTARNGRYVVTFAPPEGDYLVTVAAVGMAARTSAIKRVGTGDTLALDIRLAPVMLGAQRTTAQRQTPGRTDPARGLELGDTLRFDLLGPEQLGDLNALAALLPGATLTGDGFSVLGLDPSANRFELNGMDLRGITLPAGAVTATVSTGGTEAGAQAIGAVVSATIPDGSNVDRRSAVVRLVVPRMQWTDAASTLATTHQTAITANGVASGDLRFDRVFYRTNYELSYRSAPQLTLLNTSPGGLAVRGVAADSARRFLDLLAGNGIPTGAGSEHGLVRSGRAVTTLTFAPSNPTSRAARIIVSGSWDAASVAPGQTSVPSRGAEARSWNGMVQGFHESYSRGTTLYRSTTLQLSASQTGRVTGRLTGPAANIRNLSELTPGAPVHATLGAGGVPTVAGGTTVESVELLNVLRWKSVSGLHTFDVTTRVRTSHLTQDATPDALGTWTYASLADFGAGRADAFTRTLSGSRAAWGVSTATQSLRDVWMPSANTMWVGSVALLATRFSARISPNPSIETVFGKRNDRLPSPVTPSAALRVQHAYGDRRTTPTLLGEVTVPRPTLVAGLGVTRQALDLPLIQGVTRATGLPDGVQRVRCESDAVPTPDWPAMLSDPGTIPDRCADGTLGSAFASRSPDVRLIDASYHPPLRLAASVAWRQPLLRGRLAATITAAYSGARWLDDPVDVNFDATSRFTLADEGQRDVFVPVGSVSPASGVIGSRDARVSTAFTSVVATRSGLRSDAALVTGEIFPTVTTGPFRWSASYAWQAGRRLSDGFAGTTDGNPFRRENERLAAPRHQLRFTPRYLWLGAVDLSVSLSLVSGTRFTPRVDRDVNGDGRANDRPFVFDPAAGGDPVVGAGMAALLSEGSRSARACLRRQLRRIAGASSCDTGWSLRATSLNATLLPWRVPSMRRTSMMLSLSNPIGALDLLAHGGRAAGWGQPSSPEMVLLHVVGFDSAARRFRYQVNPLFGSTRAQVSQLRAPVVLTAMVTIDIGPAMDRQSLIETLSRGRTRPGRPATPASLTVMGLRDVPNVFTRLLPMASGLKLSPRVADSLSVLSRWFTARVDSVWSRTSSDLAAIPVRFDERETYAAYRAAREATFDFAIRVAPLVRSLLTREQRARLPLSVATMLDERYLARLRASTDVR